MFRVPFHPHSDIYPLPPLSHAILPLLTGLRLLATYTDGLCVLYVNVCRIKKIVDFQIYYLSN